MIDTLLWLDDIRDPLEGDWLVFSPIPQPFKVTWVKDYNGFVKWITDNGLPDGICFDHDLSDFQAFYNGYPDRLEADLEEAKTQGKLHLWNEQLEQEKTGLDCCKWLIDYCIDNDKELPKWNCQSANPVGKENMNALLNNFRKHQNNV